MLANASRILLCPFGLPRQAEAREVALALALACGADVGRVIDAPAGDMDRYIRHIERIGSLHDASASGARPIVLLSCSSPLVRCVLEPRRRLEAAIPALRVAPWLLFVGPEDPGFSTAARRLGRFDDDLSLAPIWNVPEHGAFLLFSLSLPSRELIAQRLAHLLRLAGQPSQTPGSSPPSPRHGQGSSPAPPPAPRQPGPWPSAPQTPSPGGNRPLKSR